MSALSSGPYLPQALRLYKAPASPAQGGPEVPQKRVETIELDVGVPVLMAAFFHILVPVLFTIVTAVVASRDAIIALPFFMFVGGLYTCAPHVLWMGIHLLAKPRASVVHGGYIGATSAMFIIGGLVFLPPEDSALPFLWVAYWPLAGILIAVSSGLACMFHRY